MTPREWGGPAAGSLAVQLARALVSVVVFACGARADNGTPDLPPAVAHLFATGRWDATPQGHRIVALSHVADACTARADLACVQRVRALAEQTRPPLARDLARDDHGLWLTHSALILADELALTRADPETALALAEIVRALAVHTLAEPTAIVPSYPNNRARWPADQSATLAALARADRLLGTHVVDEPLARYRALYVRDGVLPVSEATGAHATSGLPRGCALSWSVRYLAEVDPAVAVRLWAAYQRDFRVNLGAVAGFREWPPGVDRPADLDSGPIVHGVGAAASALAIAAARTLGDEDTAAALEGTAALAEGLGLGAGVRDTVLAAAIRDLGRHARPRLLPEGPPR